MAPAKHFVPRSPAWRQRFRGQFQKTKLCRFNAEGVCRYGEECPFAHSEEDLEGSPDLAKTSLCNEWLKGTCMKPSEQCPFAHGEQELRLTVAFTHSPLSKRAREIVEGKLGKDSANGPVQSDGGSKCGTHDGKSDCGSLRASDTTREEDDSPVDSPVDSGCSLPVASEASSLSSGSAAPSSRGSQRSYASTASTASPPGLFCDTVAYVHMQAPPTEPFISESSESKPLSPAAFAMEAPAKVQPKRRKNAAKPMPPGLVQGALLPLKGHQGSDGVGDNRSKKGQSQQRRVGRRTTQPEQAHFVNITDPSSWQMEPLSVQLAEDMAFWKPTPLMLPPVWPTPPCHMCDAYGGLLEAEYPQDWPSCQEQSAVIRNADQGCFSLHESAWWPPHLIELMP